MKKYSLILLALLLMLAACGNDTTEGYETVDIDEVQQLQDDGAIIVDVREADEFAAGHIIDAINVPLSGLRESNWSELDEEETYVIICQSGNRSIEASDILIEEDFDIVNVSEGMSSWTGETEK